MKRVIEKVASRTLAESVSMMAAAYIIGQGLVDAFGEWVGHCLYAVDEILTFHLFHSKASADTCM